jgi:H+/Cl- antiporter ClcA
MLATSNPIGRGLIMSTKLNISEKRCLEDFLKSVDDTKPSPIFPHLSSGAISILGLILFTYTVTITLNNLNGRFIYWVLFPGIIGGVGLILFGIFLLKYLKKIDEKKKMAIIIKKLID